MPGSESAPARGPYVPAWFTEARFDMFVHWGTYAVLGHGEQPLFREFLDP